MSRYVVETPCHAILGGGTHTSRQKAMQYAQRVTDLPWHELAGEGYRIRLLVSRVPPERRVVSVTVDIPEPHLARLEFLAAKANMSVRHLCSVALGGWLAGAARVESSDDAR